MKETAELIARLRERARNRVPEDNPLGMTPGDFLEGQAADHIETLEARIATLSAALEPFIGVRDQFPETLKLIKPKLHGFTPIRVTVTKDQFYAAVKACSAAREATR